MSTSSVCVPSPLHGQDLLVRARATRDLAAQLYPEPNSVSFTQRRDAFPRLVLAVQENVRAFIEQSHAGYYGSVNPQVFAVGWIRGGVGVSQPPPAERWDIGCPAFGREHAHIATFQKLGAGLQRGLRGSTNPELAELSDVAIDEFGSAGILFTNITPECASATKDAKHRTDWRRFHTMFAEALCVFRPLVVIAAGNDARHFYLDRAYPHLQQLDQVLWEPRKFDGSKGTTYWRHQGVIDLEGVPTGYLELPFHPSFAGRHAVFHTQALEAVARLGSLAQTRRMA